LLHRALAKQRQRRVLDHAAPLSLIGLNGGVTARQTLLAPTMRRLTGLPQMLGTRPTESAR